MAGIEDEDLSTQDEVRAAFEEYESDSEPPQDTPTDSAEPEGTPSRVRDEKGRFASAEAQAADKLQPEVDPQPEPQPEQQQWTKDEPPKSWSKDALPHWEKIPPEARAEIIRREEAAVQGVRQLHEKYAPVESFITGLSPFIQEARQSGVVPEQYIGGVLNSEKILRTAPLPQKFEELVRIADQYGIPLRDIIDKSVGQEVLGKVPQAQPQQAQLPPELLQQFNQMQDFMKTMQETNIRNEIQNTVAKKPHYEQVRGTMADLIEKGLATNLEEAYDKACWLVPEVRQALSSQPPQDPPKPPPERKPSIPSSKKVEVEDGEDDDLYATVRKQFVSGSTGRT